MEDTATPPSPVRPRALGEAWGAFGVVAAVALVVIHVGERTPLADYVSLAVGLLFLVTAIKLSERDDPTLVRYGLSFGGLLSLRDAEGTPARVSLRDLAVLALREVGVALLVALVVFPPFAAGFYLWNASQGAAMHPFALKWPKDAVSFFLTQLVVVALAEEAFFRGYLQTRLTDAWPTTRRILGTPLSIPAWVASALLFAVVHVAADVNPMRLAVFFPGLLFGLMRARRGGIGAALVFHALCNLYSETLAASWFG